MVYVKEVWYSSCWRRDVSSPHPCRGKAVRRTESVICHVAIDLILAEGDAHCTRRQKQYRWTECAVDVFILVQFKRQRENEWRPECT